MENSDHVAFSVPINFPTNSKKDAPFHSKAYDYTLVDLDGLCDYLRYIPWEYIFKLGASTTSVEFCTQVQLRTDVDIPHRKYQVKPHSSP